MILLFSISTLFSFQLPQEIFSGPLLLSPQISSFWNNLSLSFHSNIIENNRYLLILSGLKTTLLISIMAVFLGTILGGIICLMKMSKLKLLKSFANTFISIIRGTPVLVLLMLLFYVVFQSINIDSTVVAILGFALNFAAYSAEIFRTGIESVDSGQKEAGIALGFTKKETYLNIILPQAIRRIIPVYKSEIITLVKMTSVVGYIAVQDLTKVVDLIRSRTFDAFFPLVMVAVLYFMISWSLIMIIEYFEKKTDRRLQVQKQRAN